MMKMTIVAALFLAGALGACASQQPAGGDSSATAATQAASTAEATATENAAEAPMAFDGMPQVGTMARCPVSKETFAVAADTASSVHEGKTYVFCCPGCKGKFEANPTAFVSN